MSKIEWTEDTYNPITGCTKFSQGCKHCYAETMAKRLQRMNTRGYENGFAITVQGKDAFDKPLKRKKPTTYFVCSMGDLFHESLSYSDIERVMQIIEQCPQHTFQILTKRAANMAKFFANRAVPKNVWLGVSCENQDTANERIPHLLSIDATVRFLSCEPLLGYIDLDDIAFDRYTSMSVLHGTRLSRKSSCQSIPNAYCNKINLVIVGGESSNNARPMHPDWARLLRDQCIAANVAYFFKQWGEFIPQCQVTDSMKESGVLKVKEFGVIYKNGIYLKDHCLANPPIDVFTHKVGKKRAGNLLDGKVWQQMPKVQW